MPPTEAESVSEDKMKLTKRSKKCRPQLQLEYQGRQLLQAPRQPVPITDEAPMYFRNHAESLIPMAGTQWSAPSPDDTIPLDDAAERVYVRQLVTAFKSLDVATDKRQVRFEAESTFYPAWAFEACAWSIVVSTMSPQYI